MIKTPDIIIVSGDIIRGSTNEKNSDSEIRDQYSEAITFLNELADDFLNGNKDRIVIVPGNHDIDWRYSKQSMQRIERESVMDERNNVKIEYLKDSINQKSNTRWSWKDLSFYKINDEATYNKRLQAFSEFYEQFYEGTRRYSLDPTEQFDIFDYPNLGITIASFNSCYQNDHLRLAGDINPDSIAKVTLQLRDHKRNGRLILGTWHHNTKGLPYDSSYMDSSRLKNFIDANISLGFHGHQHKTELIHEYSNVVEQKKIVVFSAGTLCGGPAELPTGNNRQYNIIEISDIQDKNKLKVTLHIREKTESSPFENPIWIGGRIDSNNISHYSVEIDKPKLDINSKLLEIESLISASNYTDAKLALLQLDQDNDFVRKFLTECIMQTADYELALEKLIYPQTIEEAITVQNASIQLGNKLKMKEVLENVKKLPFTDSGIKELSNKIESILR